MLDVVISPRIIILELGAVGGFIGFLLISAVFIHTLLYSRSYIKNRETTLNGKSYWFSVIYLLSAIFTFIIYGFIRSNLITQTSANDYNETKCKFGYIAPLVAITINRLCLYFIIIERIKSLYIKEGILYLFLYWVMSMVAALNWSLWILIQNENETYFQLISDDLGTSIYCVHAYHQHPPYLYTIGQVGLIIIEIFLKIYLLYVFIKGLYITYLEIQHVNGVDIQFNSDEYKQLKESYDINKRFVLILLFMNGSTLTYWLFAAIIPDASTWICWDIIVNSFCVWLMLDLSEKAWKCCTKFGCCCCCYFRHYVDQYFSNSIDTYV